jgi:hypothetical protein
VNNPGFSLGRLREYRASLGGARLGARRPSSLALFPL